MVRTRHDSFKYYVFLSRQESSLEEERETGAYLVEEADALYLNDYLNSFYQSTGIGITPYEDVTISGTILRQLAEIISRVLSDLDGRPEEWPVIVGYKANPSERTAGVPDTRMASRRRLEDFLGSVEEMIREAMASGGWIHFVGGS